MTKKPVAVLPVGDVHSFDIDYLQEQLEPVFSPKIIVLTPVDKPYNDEIRIRESKLVKPIEGTDQLQYDVSRFLKLVRDTASESENEYGKVLGVTDEDLYTPGLNFIFGQAEINGKAAVISTARLKYFAFWSMGRRKEEPREIYLDRLHKEAVHELGHTFGLRHCNNRTCVMTFSNCLEDTDWKSKIFCGKCSSKIEEL